MDPRPDPKQEMANRSERFERAVETLRPFVEQTHIPWIDELLVDIRVLSEEQRKLDKDLEKKWASILWLAIYSRRDQAALQALHDDQQAWENRCKNFKEIVLQRRPWHVFACWSKTISAYRLEGKFYFQILDEHLLPRIERVSDMTMLEPFYHDLATEPSPPPTEKDFIGAELLEPAREALGLLRKSLAPGELLPESFLTYFRENEELTIIDAPFPARQ